MVRVTDEEEFFAWLDGELDAANTALAEAHVTRCEGCREELERLQAVRNLLATVPQGAREAIAAIVRTISRASGPWPATAYRRVL